jgi:hypothetical protein
MAKIYVDTTRLIDFYRTVDDRIVQLDELQKFKDSLVLTEQTITEFRRNRANSLNQLSDQLKRKIEQAPAAAIIQRFAQKELTDLHQKYQKKGEEVLNYLKQLIEDEKKDPIAQIVLALSRDPAVTNLKLTEEAIENAHRRKLLGNPPSSPDKITIGDEVIWELLLAKLREDLIVVTGDGTYQENLPLLRDEYEQKTKSKLLLVTKRLSEAVERIGKEPTQELIETEEKEQESLAKWAALQTQPFWPSADKLLSFYAINRLLFPTAAPESGAAVTNPGLTDIDIKK